MHNRQKTIVFACLALLLCSSSCKKTALKGDLIITNTNIIDVKTGDILYNRDLVILSDSIYRIEENSVTTKYIADQIIDGTDKFLIPGLWDMHTHTWWAYKDFFPLLLANGVIGIREMFGNLEEVARIRKEIQNGKIAGPEIVSAGPIVDGDPPSWQGSDAVSTPEEGREIVRQQKSAGADFVKVYNRLSREVYFAIADECKKQQIPFSGHIPVRISLEEALEAGHGTIEHFYGITDYCSSEKDYLLALYNREITNDTLIGPGTYYNRVAFEINTYDPSKQPELFRLMGENNAWVCPTMVVHKGFQRNLDHNYKDDKRLIYMPEYTTRDWKLIKDSIPTERILRQMDLEIRWYELLPPLIQPLIQNGTNFLAGTDYPNPYTFAGFSIHEELEIFVKEAGLSPLQALRTATLNPAIFLKTQEFAGSIAVGKNADLVLLTANPLEDISNTKKIEGVVTKGKYHTSKILNEQIDLIARKNRLPKISVIIKSVILADGISAGLLKYEELLQTKPDAFNFDEEQLNTLGYELIEADKLNAAIKIFELNIERFPNYANGYDSLGDAYLQADESIKAIEVWEKAVELGSSITRGKLEELKNKTLSD